MGGEQWTGDFCGNTGTAETGELAEHVQCPHCGEPVTRDPA